jgi:protein disulfide-isomerase
MRNVVSVLVASSVLTMATTTRAETLEWSKDVKTAWKAAQENEQPLLLFVSSSDCLHCQRMKKQTFQDESIVEQISKSFVAVHVDAKAEAELTKKLRVRLLPTTVIIRSDGAVIDSIRGFQTAEQFRKRLLATERTASR